MRAIAWAAAAALGLVVAYLVLGGASFAPAQVADPCTARDWRDPEGFQEVAEQIVLSALDGAACELDVTREEMVLALASGESFARFARERGISEEELDELVRSALVRAVDDAERAGAIDPTIADLVRGIAARIPVEELLDLLDQLPAL